MGLYKTGKTLEENSPLATSYLPQPDLLINLNRDFNNVLTPGFKYEYEIEVSTNDQTINFNSCEDTNNNRCSDFSADWLEEDINNIRKISLYNSEINRSIHYDIPITKIQIKLKEQCETDELVLNYENEDFEIESKTKNHSYQDCNGKTIHSTFHSDEINLNYVD